MKTHRNRELGGEVRRAVSGGEDRFGARQRVGLIRPEGRERVAVGAAQSGLHVVLAAREIQQVVDVVEEAAAVNLVHEVRSDHCAKIFLGKKQMENEENFDSRFAEL